MKYSNKNANLASLGALASIVCSLIVFNSCSKERSDINAYSKAKSTYKDYSNIELEEINDDNFSNIYEMLVKQNVPFIKIEDDYYTKNGDKILFYFEKQYVSPMEFFITERDGTTKNYLQAPEGCVLEGNKAYKYVIKFKLLDEQMPIVDVDPSTLIGIVESKKYEQLLNNYDYKLTLKR